MLPRIFVWYPNLIICYLNMSYFRMFWTFAFGKCYSRGALRFLVVLILIGTRAVLITRFPLALIFSCAGFPTFAYLGFFFSWYSRAKCQILGGVVEYDMI